MSANWCRPRVARRADPASGEDPSDRAGADSVAEPDQFALYAAMPPARVLPGQPDDEVAYLVTDPRPSGSLGVGPVPADQSTVPRHQGGRRDDPMSPQLAWKS